MRIHAYPNKKMSTIVVFQISDMYTVHTLLVRSFLQNMAEDEVAKFVVGHDSGMCKAALAGDDAPRGCSVNSKSGLQLHSTQHVKTHQV